MGQGNGVVFVMFWAVRRFAPAFFTEHKFDEQNWGFLPKAGPGGRGLSYWWKVTEYLGDGNYRRNEKWTESIAACPVKCLSLFNWGWQ
jgi:hypothetical protein